MVTGANSGIGKAIAIALGAGGADVAVNYVDEEAAAQEVVDIIVASGSRAIAVKADVSSEAEVQAMFQRMYEEFGTIDILVNNAGLQRGVVKEISAAAGKIICVSSVHEVIPWSTHANYAASKDGIMMMMKSLAQEVAPLHIRVNSICPGADPHPHQ